MIPVNVPDLSPKSKEYLKECIDTGWISSKGEFVSDFEEAFANFVGTDHGISCCNGTAALEMATTAIDIQPGDEVIMPAHTIISCPLAVVRRGGTPVLVDVESESWQMDTDSIAEKITPNTRAIMPVHMFGHPTDLDPILEIADEYDLYVIEDAAEAHGARYKGDRVGSLGHLGTFSFYANKIVTTGEGGMVVTDDDELAQRLRGARNLFFQNDRRYVHDELGANFRITNLQAAVGKAELERVGELVDRKKWQRRKYLDLLEDVDCIRSQTEQPWADHVNWMFGLVLDQTVPFNAFEWAENLLEQGVETRPFFWPIHKQPVFREQGLFNDETYPISERISKRGLYLPSGLSLTEEEIHRVSKAVIETLPA